jgi:hypothetical protein
MRWKRLIALGIGGGAIAVWIATAATTSPRGAIAVPTPAAAVVADKSAALASEISRLHERLRRDAAPTEARDLFQYARRPRAAAAVAAPHTIAPAPPESAPAPSPFKLIGLAEDGDAAAPVRSAIISANGELFIVKEGDAVTDRYHVRAISDDVVELTGAAPDDILRLALQH